MTSEEELVTKANEAFYRAFESLDIKNMEKVWAKAVHVECGHSGLARPERLGRGHGKLETNL